MKNSSRFFNNAACEYFPCHATSAPQEFNCLFCYCPLYLLPDCGGRPSWVGPQGAIKDCSGCDVPHSPGGYDRVLARLRQHFATLRAPARP